MFYKKTKTRLKYPQYERYFEQISFLDGDSENIIKAHEIIAFTINKDFFVVAAIWSYLFYLTLVIFSKIELSCLEANPLPPFLIYSSIGYV